MHELLDGYEVILLDMHHTFMFGVDRFSSRTKVIYIGDSFDADISGAASAGIDSIWINADGCHETLAPSPAKYVVPELIALTESG